MGIVACPDGILGASPRMTAEKAPFTVAFADLEPRERYKLLCATIVPRPIALVTSVGSDGVVNAAPFSFFNVFSEDPPLVVLGLQHKPQEARKDTTRNVAETGVFVVNLVDEALAEGMNVCAIDFPPDVSEIEGAGLALLPGVDVAVPRIAQAPFALECRRTVSLAFGPQRELLVGEVVRLHAREGLVDPQRLRVDADAYHPVGRLFADGYARQRDRFDLKRETYEEWRAKRER
jgi:flavin reductase (DIM6/NTAB) family NADH-FMN oxidoreductase RutF